MIMNKTSKKQNRGLVNSIKAISIVQILLYIWAFWIVLASRDPESKVIILEALIPYYSFILLGILNVCLVTLYFYLATKAHQRYDRGVIGFIFILVLLIILFMPLTNKILF